VRENVARAIVHGSQIAGMSAVSAAHAARRRIHEENRRARCASLDRSAQACIPAADDYYVVVPSAEH
jgi:hypothetical protein